MSESTVPRSVANYQKYITEVNQYLAEGKSFSEIKTIIDQDTHANSWEDRVYLIGHLSKEEKPLLNVAIDGVLANRSAEEILKTYSSKGVEPAKSILLLYSADHLKQSTAGQMKEIKKERNKIHLTAYKYTFGGAAALAAGGIGGVMALGGGYIVFGLFSIALIGLIYMVMGLYLLWTIYTA